MPIETLINTARVAVGLLTTCAPRTGVKPTAPHPHVISVENGGLLFTDNSAGVTGTDCGYSVPMGDRTLWLFGDVFLQDPKSPSRPFIRAVSNCGLLVARGQGSGPLKRYAFLTEPQGTARQLIPLAPGEGPNVRLWPFGGWYDPKLQRVYVYYATVKTTGRGPLDFQTVGYGLSRSGRDSIEKAAFVRLKTRADDKIWWHSGNEPAFGAAVVSDASNAEPFLYIVGYQQKGQKKIGKLARVGKDRIEEMAAYEYYTGNESKWSNTPADAADLEGLEDFPTELSVSFNPYIGGYLAVHTVGLGSRIRLSLALHPWGPYRSLGEIGAPARAFSRGFCYAAKEHPELRDKGGRVIYVTYVDSERYWLQLLKVTLSR